jgi:hypothetical protein
VSRWLSVWAREERGSSIVETMLALSLVVLVFAIGVEAMLVVQARTIALAAAQAGARTAAIAGEGAGLAAARQVLAAGGGLARGLTPAVEVQGATVTAIVEGPAPVPFAVGIAFPAIRASASSAVESFSAQELIARVPAAAGAGEGR